MDPLQHQSNDRNYNAYGMMYNTQGVNPNQRQQLPSGPMQPLMPSRGLSQGSSTSTGLIGNNSQQQQLSGQLDSGLFSNNIGQPGFPRSAPYPSQDPQTGLNSMTSGFSSATGGVTLMRRVGSESSPGGIGGGIGYDMQQPQYNPRIPTTNTSSIINGNNLFNQSMSPPLMGNIGQYSSSLTLLPEISSSLTSLPPDFSTISGNHDDFPVLPRPNLKPDYNNSSEFNGSLSNGMMVNGVTSSELGNQVLSSFGGMIRSYLPPDGISSTSTSAANGASSSISSSTLDSKSHTVKYGLLGLLDVIRMTDKDLNTLALGSDLAGFGLNLNSSECLYASFTSPFSEQASLSDPQYNVPPCYIMHPLSIKPENVSKFQLESLFYMFFMMPRDIMQIIAAQELYRRDWKYHGELRLWLKPRSQADMMQSNATIPFVYFDVNGWEARLFTASYRGNILAGFLSEEEIKGVQRAGPVSSGAMMMGSNQPSMS